MEDMMLRTLRFIRVAIFWAWPWTIKDGCATCCLLTLCNEEGRKKDEEENDATSCRRSVSAATACFCYHPLKFAGHQRFRVVLSQIRSIGSHAIRCFWYFSTSIMHHTSSLVCVRLFFNCLVDHKKTSALSDDQANQSPTSIFWGAYWKKEE